MSQFTICAANMPMTIVSWLRVTRRPRHGSGLPSPIYREDTLDQIPRAPPPKIRKKKKPEKACAQPVKAEETAKRIAKRINNFSRPKRSLPPPAITEPTRHPIRAQLLAQPTIRTEWSWKY